MSTEKVFAPADKIAKHGAAVQRQSQQYFFARKQGDPFFHSSESARSYPSYIQPKLNVSQPGDPQEKEADHMADKVMTMPETPTISPAPEQKEELNRKEEDKKEEVQRVGEEKEVDRKEEEKKEEVHRAEDKKEEPLQRIEDKKEDAVQKAEEKKEDTVQKAEEKKEEKVHAKIFGTSSNNSSHNFIQVKCEGCNEEKKVDRKAYRDSSSPIIQRSSRGPPAEESQNSSFEQNLHNTRGTGTVLPGETRSFMESRFSADFSGVRVHTNETSVQMNKEINAQAFTYGNDIYFNNGKFTPSSVEGKTLLAHELTHTIQQGASSHVSHPTNANTKSSTVSTKLISRKKSIQRSANLDAAVGFARGEQGKVIANKEGPDGFRFGWQPLMEYFKASLGPEKVVPDSAAGADPTTVSEGNIKKQNIAHNMAIITPDDKVAKGDRDAMPSWCGIFAFWALHKAGIPMKKWGLGNMTIPPDAAVPPGVAPQPGFLAYRNSHSHYALVSSAAGSKIVTVNGNTSGADNLGGEIQEQTHDLSHWTAFMDPMKLTDGSVRNPEQGVEGKPKSLREMQKEISKIQSKEEEGKEREDQEIQTKKENTSIQAASNEPAKTATDKKEELQKKEDAKEEEKTIHKRELIHTSADNSSPDKKDELQKKEENKEQEKTIHKKVTVQRSIDFPDKNLEMQRKEEGNEKDLAVSKKEMLQAASDGSPPDQKEEIQAKEEIKNEEGGVQRKDILQLSGDSSPPANAEEKEHKQEVQRKSEPKVQRLFGWVTDAIEWVGDKLEEGKKWLLGKVKDLIMKVPGYKAIRVVLGSDPITGETVEQNGYNFIDAAIDLMPGGSLLKKKLDELGILAEAAKFVERAFGRVEKLISGIYDTFANFFDSLSLSDLKDIPGVFRRLERAFTSFFDQIIAFAEGIASDFLEFIKKALLIPLGTYIKTKTRFWDLLCLIIGKDPLTDEVKTPTGANILTAITNLSDQGVEMRKKMQETGTFQKAAAWIDKGIAVFSKAYELLKAAFKGLWKIVSIEALMHPVDTFLKIFDSFWQPVKLVGSFFLEVAIVILKIVKDALFKWISTKAHQTKGFYLITVLISKDPFTGERVPRTTENLIKGFMLLSEGGEEQFNKMKESGAIDRAAAKIDAAVDALGFTWAYVKGLFTSLWESFTWKDLLLPVLAFVKIIDTFKGPIIKLIIFIVTVVVALFEVILRMMGFPVDLVFKLIDNIKKAWAMIKADPVGFLLNLLKAIKQGFIQFFDNILTHLWNGLKAWLQQELEDAGVPMPTDFTVMGVIKWLLAVLDITMAKIWKKLEDRIGKEKVDKIKSLIAKAEAIYDKANEAMQFIDDVRERGMDAIVDKIKEKLSNIWDLVLGAIQSFIMDQIIKKVTVKLLSMLDPTGIMAVINSAIALYKAIQSFIKYITKLLMIVNSFVEGIIEICSGNISKAANFLENSLASGIPVVIGFLANQVGLDLSGRIKEVLATVREKVDEGLTFLIDKLVGFVEKLVAKVKEAKDAILGWLGFKKTFTTEDGKSHSLYFDGEGEDPQLLVATTPKTIEDMAGERKIYLEDQKNKNKTNVVKVNEIKVQLKALEEVLKLKKGLNPIMKKYAEAVKKSAKDANALKDKINEKMNAMSIQIGIAGIGAGASNIVQTKVDKIPTAAGSPMTVKAIPLTKIPGNTAGTQPQVQPAGWSNIPKKLKPGENWVGAHILNHQLHGPGVMWNLVAGTKETNNNMKTEVENTAKKEVLNNPDKQYFFEGTVTYYPKQAKTAKEPAFDDNQFPQSIDTKFGEAVKQPDGSFKDGAIIASRPFPQDKPVTNKTEDVAFNSSSAGRLYDESVDVGVPVSKEAMSFIVKARRDNAVQTFGNSVKKMIKATDDYCVAEEGKAKNWFTNNYGTNLEELVNNGHILMDL